MVSPSYHTLNEIISQPDAWTDALAELKRQEAALQAFFRQYQPQQLLYVGCGSPFFLARTASSISRALTGIDSQAHPSSDIWLFPDQTLSKGRSSAMVVISRSGETTEVMHAIERYREMGNQAVVAVTCYENSTLVKNVQLALLARAGQEVGLAQTRSFTSMLILTQGLIHTFAGKSLSSRFHDLPALGQALIEKYRAFAEQFGGGMHRFQRFFFLGGGSLYGLSCEIMLKMKEMSLSPSEAYHFLEFRHGPMSMVNSETLVVGFVSEAATTYETAVLTEMRQKGATVLAVTPAELPSESVDHQIHLPPGLTDLERGPLYLPVLHLMIYQHTLQKGLNPDLPHNLTAVIELDGAKNKHS
jgi:glutamine---fructose-6-phosphate transaminase (isomerizing)